VGLSHGLDDREAQSRPRPGIRQTHTRLEDSDLIDRIDAQTAVADREEDTLALDAP
jgi:hypothetical protein